MIFKVPFNPNCSLIILFHNTPVEGTRLVTWVDYFACLFVCLNLLSHGVPEKKRTLCFTWLKFEGFIILAAVAGGVGFCLFCLLVLWDLCSGLRNPLLVETIPDD